MSQPVVVVTGLGRCGSSLIMRMLEAGGMPVVGTAPAYEEAAACIGRLRQDWLDRQQGRAVKVLDPLRAGISFREGRHVVILATRDPEQQAKSQFKFLQVMGFAPASNRRARAALARSIARDTSELRYAVARVPALIVRFDLLVRAPGPYAEALDIVLGRWFEGLHIRDAAGLVVPRSPLCAPSMQMELNQLADMEAHGGTL